MSDYFDIICLIGAAILATLSYTHWEIHKHIVGYMGGFSAGFIFGLGILLFVLAIIPTNREVD
jgi:hypothetical protein